MSSAGSIVEDLYWSRCELNINVNIAIYVSSYSTIIIMYLPVCIEACMRMNVTKNDKIQYDAEAAHPIWTLDKIYDESSCLLLKTDWRRSHKT